MPNEKRVLTEIHTVRLICNCSTEMKLEKDLGKGRISLYKHQCPKCKHTEITAKAYPYLEYREVEMGKDKWRKEK